MLVSGARFPSKSSVPALAIEYLAKDFVPDFSSSAKPAGKSAPLGRRSFLGFVFFHSHNRSGFCSAGKHLFFAKMQMEGFTGSGCICHPRRNHDGSGLAIPLGCTAPKCSAQPICRLRIPLEGKVLLTESNMLPQACRAPICRFCWPSRPQNLTLILFFLGLFTAAIGIKAKSLDWRKWLIPLLWFFVPLLAVVVLNSTMYDNFRQFFFILPAAFLFVGAGLDWLFARVRSPVLISLLLIVFVLLNVVTLVQLHPYQYTYYNRLAGGQQGAFRKYEMDYWATSYKDAAEFLNKAAPLGSTVVVVGPSHIVEHYARPDLQIEEYSAKNPKVSDEPYYSVILTRHNKDQSLFPEAIQVFSIGRKNSVFAVVKYIVP